MNRRGTVLQAAGGHILDLYRLLRFEPRNPHSYSKFRQITSLARRAGADTLVEAGTYVGNTAMRCSKVFEKVVTIELDEKLYRQAAGYLASRSNVECLLGDALELLPKVLERPELDKVLVFLDGHFSGGSTALGSFTEPACEELRVLAQFRHKLRAVIVDDFRCFGAEDWPKKSELLKAAEDFLGPDFDMTVHLDQLLLWRRNS